MVRTCCMGQSGLHLALRLTTIKHTWYTLALNARKRKRAGYTSPHQRRRIRQRYGYGTWKSRPGRVNDGVRAGQSGAWSSSGGDPDTRQKDSGPVARDGEWTGSRCGWPDRLLLWRSAGFGSAESQMGGIVGWVGRCAGFSATDDVCRNDERDVALGRAGHVGRRAWCRTNTG